MERGVGGVAPRAGQEIAAELIRRRQKIDQDELEFSVLAAQFAETDEYEWQGFDSAHTWLKANCHISGGAAAARICVGRQVEQIAQSSAAMAAGEIGFAHFALIARTSAAVGERLDQTALLRQARKHTIARFHDDCYHARHAADPKGCAKEEARRVEARSLDISDGDEGTVYINGYLDKVRGAAVRTALEPLAQRAGKDDHRPREQRMGDGLLDVCTRAVGITGWGRSAAGRSCARTTAACSRFRRRLDSNAFRADQTKKESRASRGPAHSTPDDQWCASRRSWIRFRFPSLLSLAFVYLS